MPGIVLSARAMAAGKAASSELLDECSKNTDPVCWENSVAFNTASLSHYNLVSSSLGEGNIL